MEKHKFIHRCTAEVNPFSAGFAEGAVKLRRIAHRERPGVVWFRWGVSIASGFDEQSIVYHGPTWTANHSTVKDDDLMATIAWATDLAKRTAWSNPALATACVMVWCEEVQ